MRESAKEAGLSAESIIIALEPEAASVYCRQLDVCVKLSSLKIGSKNISCWMLEAENKIIFAAIDLGTSFSGWAFASNSELDRKSNIYVKPWYSTYISQATGKTSTCALIKPDGVTLDSFGYVAEKRYENLVSENQHERYFFFKNFKTGLYGKYYQPLNTGMKLVDKMGRVLPAINVFSASIKFLAEDMFTDIKRRFQDLRWGDIKWVITVPAIWTDQAKYLMRESAKEAGLSTESIIIALEPEAASVYCRQLDVCAINRDSGVRLSSLKIESKYLVLDAGGGTMDLTVHEITSCECIKQVVAASGNIYGGNSVNTEFEKLLKTIVTDDKYEDFKRTETEDWLYLMADFESKKKSFNPNERENVNMRFPQSFKKVYESKLSSIFSKFKKSKSLKDAFGEMGITLKKDKIIIPSHIFSKFFQQATERAIGEIKKMIGKMHGETISCILMVGGFSECVLLQQSVMTEFPEIPVVVPAEASTAVLKGAVLYGYCPPIISERVVKYTYGVSGGTEFIPGAHPIEKRVVTDVGVLCDDIFYKHVTRGDSVKTGESQSKELYFPRFRNQKKVKWDICASKLKNPRYTTDKDCHIIGKIILDLSDTDDTCNSELEVVFAFGGTEIIVTAEEARTGRKVKTIVSFLE